MEPHKKWLLNRYISTTIYVCIVLKSALVAEMANKEIRQRFKKLNLAHKSASSGKCGRGRCCASSNSAINSFQEVSAK